MSIFLIGTLATLATAPLALLLLWPACDRRKTLAQRKRWAISLIGFGIVVGILHGAFRFGLSLEMNTPQPLWHLLVSAIRS